MFSARVGALVSPIFLARVRDVKVSPDPSGLPGKPAFCRTSSTASHSGCCSPRSRAFSLAPECGPSPPTATTITCLRAVALGALVSACAALAIGAAGAIINFFADLGGKVK